MRLLAPAAAAFAVTLPLIVLLYFLKIRRPRVSIPSTLLWRRAVRDRQANAPWQRLRFSWLLLLQLLVAAAMVGALVRPALARQSTLSGHTVILLDTSVTMQATDVAPNRFALARQQVRDLVSGAGSGDRVTLVELGPVPRILATANGDMAPVYRALDQLSPHAGAADLQQALALAASVASRGESTRLVLFSDGIVAPLRAAVTLPFPFEYHRVGLSAENVAITALDVQGQAAARRAFVRVQNFGRQRHHVNVEWHVDGRLADARALDLDGAGAAEVTFAVPPGARTVQGRLTGGDFLAADDVAWGVATVPKRLHVVLVTKGNVFMQRALQLRADLDVKTIAPAAYHYDPSVDMYVFDGFAPSPVPSTPAWFVNPPQGTFGVGAATGVGLLRAGQAEDPLLQDVDLRDVHVARSADLGHNSFGGRVLLDSAAGPMALVRESPTRAVLVGFDLHSSDLPLRTAFPILVDHIDSFLLPASVGPRAYHPDEPVLIAPVAGGTMVTVTRPGGRRDNLGLGGGALTPLAYANTDDTGVYAVEQRTTAGVTVSQFAVNPSPDLSDISPRERIDLLGSAPGAAARQTTDLVELWPWVAGVALLLLTAEWLVFHRGL